MQDYESATMRRQYPYISDIFYCPQEDTHILPYILSAGLLSVYPVSSTIC